MRNFKTVYPSFESGLNKILLTINKSIELDRHSPRTIEMLQNLSNDVLRVMNTLEKKPSIHAYNLGLAINKLYTIDTSVHVLNVKVHLVKNADLSRSSQLVFRMYS